MKRFNLFIVFIFILLFLFCSVGAGFSALAEEGTLETVQVVYLTQIDDTPFAERKIVNINIPVYGNHTIKVADVAAKIGNNAYGVLCSYCDKYTYVADGDYYMAQYHKSVYLNAITTDAHVEHYFLDVNNTFYEYYSQFVLGSVASLSSGTSSVSLLAQSMGGGDSHGHLWDGTDTSQGRSPLDILPVDLYDFYLNRIHVTYPQLNGYGSNDIYGYWGWVAIPHSNSINDLLSTQVFSIPNTFDGILQQIKYSETLSREAYNSLLDDYGYSWFATLWSAVIGDFGLGSNKLADFYMFYGDGKTLTPFIGQNGATNADDTQIGVAHVAEDVLNNVGEFLDSVLADSDKIFMLVGGFLGVIVIVVIIRTMIRIGEASERFKKRRGKK